jgi:chromosome segregation ATPase
MGPTPEYRGRPWSDDEKARLLQKEVADRAATEASLQAELEDLRQQLREARRRIRDLEARSVEERARYAGFADEIARLQTQLSRGD